MQSSRQLRMNNSIQCEFGIFVAHDIKNVNMRYLLVAICSVLTFNILAQNPSSEVKVGAQIWSVTNLNTAKFRNGDLIPQAKTVEEWKMAGKERNPAWCYYEFSAENGLKYGKLYNWYAVNDDRGLAPSGYKIPSDTDWKVLVDYCGGIMDAGNKLKSATGWEENGNGIEPNGFNGLPGGFCLENGTFAGLTVVGAWWTSTEGAGIENENTSWDRYLESDKDAVETYSEPQALGFSVRCIKVDK